MDIPRAEGCESDTVRLQTRCPQVHAVCNAIPDKLLSQYKSDRVSPPTKMSSYVHNQSQALDL